MIMTKIVRTLLLTATLLFVWGSPSHGDSPAGDPTDDTTISAKDRALIVSKIYLGVEMYFGHRQAIPDFDLEKEYRTLLDEAFAAKNRLEFDLACTAFIAKLNNGHSNFYDPWLSNHNGESMGFRAGYYENKWVVDYSRIPELKVGDVIDAIDGRPFEAFYQSRKGYISASSERERRGHFLSQRYLFPSTFQLKKGDGATVTIKRIPFLTQDEKTSGRWIEPGEIAYIKIPAFQPADFERDALKLLETFRSAKNLILDLRGNDGGSTPSNLIDALMDRPYRGSSWTTPQHTAVFKVYGAYVDNLDKDPKTVHDQNYGELSTLRDFGTGIFSSLSSWTKPKNTLFKNRLFILIDRQVFSAGEDCCIPFKDNHRAIFIGETTAGSTGQPYIVRFPNGMFFRVSAKRDSFPDGSPFEGVGVTPDIPITTTIDSLRSHRDLALEKALELAHQR